MVKGHRHREEHEEHEEHVNHEAWVIPYADMLTLLMALFLVLFAIGRVDAGKAKAAEQSFRNQINGSAVLSLGGSGHTPIVSGNGVLDQSIAEISAPQSTIVGPVDLGRKTQVSTDTGPAASKEANQALADQRAGLERARSSARSLEGVRRQLQAEADAAGLGKELGFHLEARGLVVTIVTDQVLFEPGMADLQASGVALLDIVAHVLSTVPNNISIEGHTDSRPISTQQFPSNWELSTARATSVLRYLIDHHGLAADRLSAAGYADTRPIDSNDTIQGATRNRRVEVVVLSDVSLAAILAKSTIAG